MVISDGGGLNRSCIYTTTRVDVSPAILYEATATDIRLLTEIAEAVLSVTIVKSHMPSIALTHDMHLWTQYIELNRMYRACAKDIYIGIV